LVDRRKPEKVKKSILSPSRNLKTEEETNLDDLSSDGSDRYREEQAQDSVMTIPKRTSPTERSDDDEDCRNYSAVNDTFPERDPLVDRIGMLNRSIRERKFTFVASFVCKAADQADENDSQAARFERKAECQYFVSFIVSSRIAMIDSHPICFVERATIAKMLSARRLTSIRPRSLNSVAWCSSLGQEQRRTSEKRRVRLERKELERGEEAV